jgi:hypothetical protein
MKNIPSWGRTIIYGTLAGLAIRLIIPRIANPTKYF